MDTLALVQEPDMGDLFEVVEASGRQPEPFSFFLTFILA